MSESVNPSTRAGLSISTQSLHCYVSRLLRERLSRDTVQSAPRADDVPVAVLLSDLQGFTALVEQFSREGRAGLEELTWALNSDFANLADIVDEHGGDVVSIAGDAFLCVWVAESPAALPGAVAMAAAAGLAIQAKLHARGVNDRLHLATRIGIGAGTATIATVGGVNGRWELLVSGSAIRDAVAAEHAAQAGQVAAAASAWSLLRSRAHGARIGDDTVVVESVQVVETAAVRAPVVLPPERLRPHVPAAVLDRLQMPSAEWLAESRPVTVLFTAIPSLSDLPGAPDERVALTHTMVSEFQRIVALFEGTAKVDMDDKGTLLLATWGLPPRAHEDDATRAIQASWALRDALAAHTLAAGIGVASGRAICGAFGSDRRRDYMVRGDVINLAARLMGVEKGDITCDEATTHATRGAVSFATLPPARVKGRAEPVAVFRPLARRSRAEARHAGAGAPTTVGRAREWVELTTTWRALRDGGDGGVRVIEGDAGLGKSTLVADLAGMAATEGALVLLAAADAIDRTTPYFAWRPLFTELLGVKGASDEIAAVTIAERLRELRGMERLLPLLSSVLPVRLADNELTTEMSGDVRADNTRRLLVAVLRHALRDRATLLVVEDAHWLDSASSALLFDVARDVRPLLTIVTSRPATSSFTTGANLTSGSDHLRLLSLPGAAAMRLEQLNDAETDALVANRLGVAKAPPALLEYVRARVAGHPFFCDELVQAMIASGAVTVERGMCTVGDLSALDLPTTVEGMIVSRLDRLTPSQQLCLKIAAVVGRVFRARTVSDTHPVSAEAPQVSRHLASLTRQELTALETPEPDLAYRFRHVTTRDVTYELMPRAQRQPLHRAVAEWTERAHQGALAPMAALLAYHWTQAGDTPKSADYLEMAGDNALRDGAFSEAALFYNDALALGARVPQVADALRRACWHKGLGTARYFLGDLAGSRDHLETAVAMLDRPVPPAGGASVIGLLRAALRQAVIRSAPGLMLGRGASDRARLDDATDCYRALGQIYFLQGEPAPRLGYLTVRGLNVGESAGPSPALARILANMGTLTSLMGRKEWSDWYGARAVVMAEREGQYAAAAYVWHIEAIRHITNGRIARALEANASAQALIEQLGDYNLELEAWSVRAMILASAMDCAAGPETAQRCVERARAADGASLGCWAQLNLVDFALGAADVPAADAALDSALAWPTLDDDIASILLKQRGTAVVRAAQQRWPEAIEAARNVITVARRHSPTAYYLAEAHAMALEVLARAFGAGAAPDATSTLAMVTSGVPRVRSLARNFWNLRARAPFLEGMVGELAGRRDASVQAFTRSAEVARTMDMPYERARALTALARVSDGETRSAMMGEASAICEALGVRVGAAT